MRAVSTGLHGHTAGYVRGTGVSGARIGARTGDWLVLCGGTADEFWTRAMLRRSNTRRAAGFQDQ